MAAYIIIYFMVSLLWLFIFHKGSGLKINYIAQAFSAGIGAAMVAAFLSYYLKSEFITTNVKDFVIADFFLYFFIVGPIEEASKFLALFLIVLRKTDLKRASSVLTLGMAVALGFAGLENILYLVLYGVQATLPRLILGNLGHAAFGIFWSYALGVVLCEKAPQRLLVVGLFLSAIAHGAYDYFLGFSLEISIISFLLAALLIIFMVKMIKVESNR